MSKRESTDLSQRIYLRPDELYTVFGVRDSYLRALEKRDPESAPKIRRLPGARGVILRHKEDMRRWIESFVED